MTRRTKRLMLLAGPITALTFAACGGATSSPSSEASPLPSVNVSPETSPSASLDVSPSLSLEPSMSASPSGSSDVTGGGGNLADLTADPELMASIPDEADDITITKTSLADADFIDESPLDQVAQVLTQLGVSQDQVGAAAGVGESDLGRVDIVALSVQGVDANVLQQAAATVFTSDPEVTGSETETVGGKQVVRVTDPSQNAPQIYLYTTGDRLYVVSSTGNIADSVLQQLPS